MNEIKAFNYKYIYNCKKLQSANKYFELVINEIYDTLISSYDGKSFLSSVKNLKKHYPNLSNSFYKFLQPYCKSINREELRLRNKIIFNDENIENFHQAILYYISGMTDHFAMNTYQEIIGF